MRKAISIWLIAEDGENKGKIVLQRRSEKDSSSYVYQPAWAGGIELGEQPRDTILRECKEELGEEFFSKFDFSKIKLFEKVNFTEKEEKWEVSNYLGKVSEKLLKTAKICDESFKDFSFLEKNALFHPVSSGKDPKNNIVLFDDQYEILRRILNNN